jgi:hypothetical protein
LDPFININTNRLASYKAAGHRSRYFGRLQLEHKAATHCSCNKHLAQKRKKREREREREREEEEEKKKKTIFLPCLVCLLKNENVNK